MPYLLPLVVEAPLFSGRLALTICQLRDARHALSGRLLDGGETR
jgi:hypothetical protein